MAYDTIVQQGRFTSDGSNKRLLLRSDLDWIHVRNETTLYAAGADVAAEFFFQRGMTSGRGLRYTKESTIGALVPTQIAVGEGFTLINSNENVLGGPIAITSNTDDPQPVYSVADTSTLRNGSIVRTANITGSTSINSFDFEVDALAANTSFRMRFAMANAPGVVGANGTYRIINFDPQFYPRRRFVVDATATDPLVVTTSVQHGYSVGQEVRFNIPSEWGMVELDGLSGAITATTIGTITVDIDASAFSGFTFPLPAKVPFTFAQVIPLGEDTGVALANNIDILSDAVEDTAFIGVELTGGAGAPAGASGNVIYWVAGKSFAVSNE
jgi:hypothetical protein